MEDLTELMEFLKVHSRTDLKSISLTNLLSLTGSSEGLQLVLSSPELIKTVYRLTADNQKVIAKDALLVIVNVSAEKIGAEILLKEIASILDDSLQAVQDENCELADAWTMVLSNISRSEHLVPTIIDHITNSSGNTLAKLMNCYTKIGYNKEKCHLNYLGSLFSNLTTHARGQELFCEASLLQKLIPFVQYPDSVIRRGGAIGLIKNISFDTNRHDWLLYCDDVDILPIILLPLAGPEELSDTDNDMLPIALQYLDSNKKREPDPDCRKMLLETLQQLCATKKAREYLRSRGTYEILRELHKYEVTDNGDPLALICCENVVDILIRTEQEIGENNLKEMEIPSELVEKFDQLETVT